MGKDNDTRDDNADTDVEDSKLSARYQQLNKDMPADHVDEAILSLARLHSQSHNPKQVRPASPFSGRWKTSSSMVAILVIAFGLVTFIDQEAPEQIRPVPSAPDDRMLSLDESISLNSELEKSEHKISPAASPVAKAQPELKFKKQKSTDSKEKVVPGKLAKAVEPSSSTIVQKRAIIQQDTLLSAENKFKLREEKSKIKKEIVDSPDSVSPSITSAATAFPATVAPAREALSETTNESFSTQRKRQVSPPNKPFADNISSLMLSPSGNATPCSTDTRKLDVSDYWRSNILNQIVVISFNSEILCLAYPDKDINDVVYVEKNELDNYELKQIVYLDILEDIFKQLKTPVLTNSDKDRLIQSLKKITTYQFNSISEWQLWYTLNHTILKLTDDGERITIGK